MQFDPQLHIQLQQTLDLIKSKILASLDKPFLIRKSFEYGETFLSDKSILQLAKSLRADEPRSALSSTDDYWNLEHARWYAVKNFLELPYTDFLPGRIHTYRLFAKHIATLTDSNSAVDVGCGSGMMLHELNRIGIRADGIDNSVEALHLAKAIAESEYEYSPKLVCSDALKLGALLPDNRYDIVTNLGSLEHLPFKKQIQFVTYMTSLTRKYIAICIPNKSSYFFNTMEDSELSLSDNKLVYPEEFDQHIVEFDLLRKELGGKLVGRVGIHCIPTSITATKAIEKQFGIQFNPPRKSCVSYLQRLEHAEKFERSLQHQLVVKQGWFYCEIWDMEHHSLAS